LFRHGTVRASVVALKPHLFASVQKRDINKAVEMSLTLHHRRLFANLTIGIGKDWIS
jgi:hypothetical protein